MPVSSSTEHWIKPDALTINLNHFGDPDYLQVSVLAGAVVMAFKQDVIGYNAAHNYRTWPLEAANTYLETSSAYNVYARLTRSEVNARALIVYDTVLRDIEGREITYVEVKPEDLDSFGNLIEGGEIIVNEKGEKYKEELGEANPDFFYIHLGEISSSLDISGRGVLREWIIDFKFGSLDTNQYQNEEGGGEWNKLFHWNKVTDLIEVLKTFSSAIFKTLSIGEKPITDIKRTVDSDNEFILDENGNEILDEEGNPIKDPKFVSVSDESIPTTAWVAKHNENKYLRKDTDDRSIGKISSDKGFEVGKFESGTLGTGASMYEGEDKNTYIEADFLKIRKKATFTTISVQELKHVGGEIILSPAAMICSKVEETELGYKCYFNTEDSDGRKIYNEFEVGDFARCQTFNLEHNKYYWRYVSEVGNDYIVLSKFDCDSNSDIPEAGDNISQLGNRYDEERQNAIVLSAYGEDAPSYKQYNGINEYALSEGMLVTKLSPKGNVLKGDFISQSTGKNIEQEFEKVKVDWDKVLSQTDKEFTMWFYEYEPTLDNIPASEWNTDELKALHEQDLFYDLSTGYAYRFEFVDGAYKWNIVTDGETIKALEKAAKAQEAADKVKENLEEIVSDGILSALEKKEVLKEWNTIVSVYPRNIETANKHGLSTSAYTNAYMMLGQYLNGGSTWDGHSIPLWLSETDKNQEIDAESYRGYWTDYYDAESEILDAVTGDVDKKADEKKRVFVSQPTPPYEVGDMWVNATYGEYKNDCLVCISRRIQGDLFFISDWRPVSSVTNKVKESIEENIKNLAESAGGNEVYTQNDNPWNSWESGTEWKHVGAIWHCTRNVINTITKEIIYYEGHTYRYYGYDNTDLWEDITNLVYTSSYFMRNEKQIAGVVGAYDENGNLKEDSGFVVTSNFAKIFSENSKVQAAVQTSVNDGISQATIKADKINFLGKTIINGNFIVTNDGDLRVKADISANTLSLLTKTYGGSMSDYSLGYGEGSYTLPRIDNSNGQLFREVKFLAPNHSRTASNVTVSVYDSGSETILYQDEDGIIKSSSSVSLNVNTLYTFTAISIESGWFSAEYIWFVSSQELAKF